MKYLLITSFIYLIISAFISGKRYEDSKYENRRYYKIVWYGVFVFDFLFYIPYRIIVTLLLIIKVSLIHLDENYLYIMLRYNLKYTDKLNNLSDNRIAKIKEFIRKRNNKPKKTLKDRLYIKYGNKILERNKKS